jgi:formate hydrogenlyase subunit 3/multisubunit Na+/H+ antiporter MnhD subunit
MILLAAATKSAQLPFSSWLPRAMEGPTSSSAIFYGSLSVHLGVFLLIRTYPYWETVTIMKILVIATGILTSIVATSIAGVQSSIKTQIAYSSIAQIGLMFVEVALGFHLLALIHFSGNAFLRTYQLLVSPSVLSYRIHEMAFSFIPGGPTKNTGWFSRYKNSLYILSLKEWNLDTMMFRFLWQPFKWLGRKTGIMFSSAFVFLLALLFLFGLYIDFYPDSIPFNIYEKLPLVFSLAGFLMIISSFTERKNSRKAWLGLIAAQLFITLSIALYHIDFGHDFMLIYLSGSLLSSLAGFICLTKIHTLERQSDLNQFYGHSYEHPGLAFIFLLSCLGLIGFPFTPTFIGVDLIFSHIHKQEILLIILTALSFIFMELAAFRIYARTFLGPHKKSYHPVAFKSS